MGVDEHGIIKFVESVNDNKPEEHIRSCGWQSWETFKAPKGRVGFWFPGFIGTCILSEYYQTVGTILISTSLDYMLRLRFTISLCPDTTDLFIWRNLLI